MCMRRDKSQGDGQGWEARGGKPGVGSIGVFFSPFQFSLMLFKFAFNLGLTK